MIGIGIMRILEEFADGRNVWKVLLKRGYGIGAAINSKGMTNTSLAKAETGSDAAREEIINLDMAIG